MIIAIEGQRIFRKKKHGMDFVALETIREIQKIDKTNQYYIIVAHGE
ncbi:MAG TPA: glycosyltransferase family 1 protein, partial [Bacteroidales bacterium]|nr:glycosyltransferase family 1 protein [Bacteroidales bacterium]